MWPPGLRNNESLRWVCLNFQSPFLSLEQAPKLGGESYKTVGKSMVPDKAQSHRAELREAPECRPGAIQGHEDPSFPLLESRPGSPTRSPFAKARESQRSSVYAAKKL